MPATRPSKSSVSSVIGALIAAGLQPGAIRVQADGSFCVDVTSPGVGGPIFDKKIIAKSVDASASEAPAWGEGKCE